MQEGVGAAGAPRRLRLLRLRRRLVPTISARRTVLSPRALPLMRSDAVLVRHSMGVTGCAFLPWCAHARRPSLLPFTLSPSPPLTLTSRLFRPKDNEWLLSRHRTAQCLWNLAARTSSARTARLGGSRRDLGRCMQPLGYYFASASHDGAAPSGLRSTPLLFAGLSATCLTSTRCAFIRMV